MTKESPSLTDRWRQLTDKAASIESLMRQYPDHWDAVKGDVAAVMGSGRPEAVHDLIRQADRSARHWHEFVMREHFSSRSLTRALPPMVRSRMIHLAVRRVLNRELGSTGSGPIPQPPLDRVLMNFLVYFRYRAGLPVSARMFRMLWPLVRNKPAAMGVAKQLGIYSFVSTELVRLLAVHLRGRRVLEIAAGSGLLSSFLAAAGVDCTATDDLSWGHAVRFGKNVRDLDAAQALREYQPDVVLCAWPPPGNDFERHVFAASCVQKYIVLGSQHEFATGNRDLYRSQQNFSCMPDASLTRAVLPPEGGHEALVFRRGGVL